MKEFMFTGQIKELRPYGTMTYHYQNGKLVNKTYKLFWYYRIINNLKKLFNV